MPLTDEQLLRYSRQILLPAFGVEAQEKLLAARVLLIGAGGLGSAAALYLAAAGIGTLVIADHDRVDLSNLQRQILHRQGALGRPKVESARETLGALNPDVEVVPLDARLTADNLRDRIAGVDLVIDGSDNFDTRFAVNEACVAGRRPLVSGAAIRSEGQLSVFRADLGEGPCYRCLYGEAGAVEETCAENGVLAPVVGIIGSLQALEAIKVLTGLGEPLHGRLLVFDGMTLECREMRLPRDPACPVCGK